MNLKDAIKRVECMGLESTFIVVDSLKRERDTWKAMAEHCKYNYLGNGCQYGSMVVQHKCTRRSCPLMKGVWK